MFDGLESARSRERGHFEYVEIQLGRMIAISKIRLDFTFFTNNNPRAVDVLAFMDGRWVEIRGETPTKAFAGKIQDLIPKASAKTDKIRVRTFPDGGINRIHVYGNPL
jgi:allantoicase